MTHFTSLVFFSINYLSGGVDVIDLSTLDLLSSFMLSINHALCACLFAPICTRLDFDF